jgi:hypothetical protein
VHVQDDLDGRAHQRSPARLSIADLEATGMVLRLGANARRIDTGAHRVFAVTPGTQAAKTSGPDVLTRLHDHEAAAAGVDYPTACYPGNQVSMLDWLTHDGQAYAAANGYVPLPAQIQQLAHSTLQQITGPTRARLLS